jgi:peptidoglycan/LPS O-acetylase OafA/YrhL
MGVTLDLDAFKYGAVLLMTTSMVLGVIAGYHGVIGRVLDIHWMGHLGRISYGLYLYHMPIPVLLKLAVVKLGVGFPGWVLLMLSLSLTVIIAELSFRYLETPFLRLKERFDL